MTITPFYVLGADMMPVRIYRAEAKRIEGMKFERYGVERKTMSEALTDCFRQMTCRHIYVLRNYAEKKCGECGHLTDDR